MTTLAEYKKEREAKLENLTRKLSASTYTKPEKEVDETYWTPTKDALGNASAIIRWLPGHPDEEDAEYITTHEYSWKNPETGKYYIEKALSSIGSKEDPMAAYNTKKYATHPDLQRKEGRGRKTNHHSNIFVVKDPGNPESEGKVFKFKYGNQILGILKEAMVPSSELDTAFNPFDLYEGANFRLIVAPKEVPVDGKKITMPDYTRSKFEAVGPLFKDEKKMDAVFQSQYKLKYLIDPENYKTPEELRKRLDIVLGTSGSNIEDLVKESGPNKSEPKSTRVIQERTESSISENNDEDQWFKDLEELDTE